MEHLSSEKMGFERTDLFIESVCCPPNVPPSHKHKSLKSKRDLIVGSLGIIPLPFPQHFPMENIQSLGFQPFAEMSTFSKG